MKEIRFYLFRISLTPTIPHIKRGIYSSRWLLHGSFEIFNHHKLWMQMPAESDQALGGGRIVTDGAIFLAEHTVYDP